MNKELNLVEIFKNVPKGTKFWSSVMGYSVFSGISDSPCCPITFKGFNVSSKGEYYAGNGECTIFPSKDQRDWSKFKVDLPIDTPMMICFSDSNDWCLRYYAGNKKCYINGYKSTNKERDTTFDYMVPVSEFDFTNPESNINKSI